LITLHYIYTHTHATLTSLISTTVYLQFTQLLQWFKGIGLNGTDVVVIKVELAQFSKSLETLLPYGFDEIVLKREPS